MAVFSPQMVLKFCSFALPIHGIRQMTAAVRPRKSLQTFESEEAYRRWLKFIIAKKQRAREAKKIKPPENIPKPVNEISFKENLPKTLQNLKYKKLRDLPGNVLIRMIADVNTSFERPYRDLCLVTSQHVIKEALAADDFVRNVYFNRLEKLQMFPIHLLSKVHLIHIPDSKLKFLPDYCKKGVFAVVGVQKVKSRQMLLEKRRAEDMQKRRSLIPTTVICAGIKNVSEIGKIIYFAERFGCQQVFLLDNCVDAWTNEALSIGKGAHFKIPIIQNLSWETMTKLEYGNYLHVLHKSKTDLTMEDFASQEMLQKYQRSTRIIEAIASESGLDQYSNNKETNFRICARSLSDVNLLHSNTLLVGNIDFEAFRFAANSNFKECFILNTFDDVEPQNFSKQLLSVLVETKNQESERNKKI